MRGTLWVPVFNVDLEALLDCEDGLDEFLSDDPSRVEASLGVDSAGVAFASARLFASPCEVAA